MHEGALDNSTNRDFAIRKQEIYLDPDGPHGRNHLKGAVLVRLAGCKTSAKFSKKSGQNISHFPGEPIVVLLRKRVEGGHETLS